MTTRTDTPAAPATETDAGTPTALSALLAGTLVGTLSNNIINVPLPQILSDFDASLDDGALRGLFAKDQTAFKNAVIRLMEATQLDRTAANTESERTRIRERSNAVADKMARIFAEHAGNYERLVSIDGARIDTLGEIGANAIEIRYPVDSQARPQYEKAISQSVAQARSGIVSSLFDKLREEADDMPSSGGSSAAHPEQIASFALLSLSAPEKTELRFVLKTDNSSCSLCGDRDRYDAAGFRSLDVFAKGPQVSTIASGLFDINAIIAAPQ